MNYFKPRLLIVKTKQNKTTIESKKKCLIYGLIFGFMMAGWIIKDNHISCLNNRIGNEYAP